MIPRRGAVALALTAVALVLLLSFKTPTAPMVVGTTGGGALAAATPTPAGVGRQGGDLGSPGSTPSAPAISTPPTGPGGSAGGASGSGRFTGAVVDTMYGPVQVAISVSGGKVTDITALQLPGDRRRSAAISQYAGPILRSEALKAQSAQIDTVSGATYTSQGYEQSLQSALDQAHG